MDIRSTSPLLVTDLFEIHVGTYGESPEEVYLVINKDTWVCEYCDMRWIYAKSYATGMTDEILKQNSAVVKAPAPANPTPDAPRAA